MSLYVDDVGSALPPLVAAVLCWKRSRRETSRLRTGWALLGLSSLLWALGEVLWCLYELIGDPEVPFPSWPDVGFLLSVPLALCALLCFFRPPDGWTSQLRVMVDALVITSALVLLSWLTVLGPMIASTGHDLAAVVGLAYPVGDILLASVVLIVGGRAREEDNLPVRLITFGVLALAISDSAFAYLTQTGAYGNVNTLDAGWFVGFSLFCLAAVRPPLSSRRRAWRGDRMLLPYATVVIVLAALLGRAVTGRPVDGFLLLNVLAMVAFLVLRQVLTLKENRALTQGLESMVVARTEQLAASEERSRVLVQSVSDVLMVVRPDGAILFASPSALAVLGYTPETLTQLSFLELLHPADLPGVGAYFDSGSGAPLSSRRLQLRLRHGAGHWLDVETVATDAVHLDPLGGFVLTTRDITQQRALQEQLRHQAFHDSLTGLPNRALFTDRTQHALAVVRRTARDLTVLFIDLDDFKSVNDTLGHGQGDALLKEMGRRLVAAVRPGDTVTRLGGDEFAVLMEDASEEAALAAASRIHEVLGHPWSLEGTERTLTASIGIARSAAETASAEDVLRNADLAMYQAKSAGKGCSEVFRPELHRAVVERVQLQADLRLALAADQFALHYQPLVSLTTKDVVGFEALVRWLHPSRGMVPPLDFIPLAEESGLIIPLGEWVLTEAIAQLLEWDRTLGRCAAELTMSVNVSGRQLQGAGFVEACARVLEESGVEPARVTLELTESTLVEHSAQVMDQLLALKELGVKLAIDDFGTGFSSLSYLRSFPVDTLKIDKSFVDDLRGPGDAGDLVQAVIDIGTSLGLKTIAEGIESRQQAELLALGGCGVGQGFAFSRPLPGDAMAEWLRGADLASRIPAARTSEETRKPLGAAQAD